MLIISFKVIIPVVDFSARHPEFDFCFVWWRERMLFKRLKLDFSYLPHPSLPSVVKLKVPSLPLLVFDTIFAFLL